MKPVNDKSSHVKKLKKYLLALVVLSLALGVLVVPAERAFQIKNIGDGIWWAIVTVTDVGYGDYVPVT
ncbi:MAG TPA: potassium channel family protein, partial [Patescibacteria group bacterium]|nr:potassium channel family protein [Patescibacteria group bacterium]